MTINPLPLFTASAALVTRAGGITDQSVDALVSYFGEVVVWENGVGARRRMRTGSCNLQAFPVPPWVEVMSGRDQIVFGRYIAAMLCRSKIIYTQDDDCLVPFRHVFEAYEPKRIVCNMPAEHQAQYAGDPIRLLGFGAVFDQGLENEAFVRWNRAHGTGNAIFMRECDRIFTALTPSTTIDVGVAHLEKADAPDRLWKQADHHQNLQRVRELLKGIR